jgi:integrase
MMGTKNSSPAHPRTHNKLSSSTVRSIIKPGRYSDGGGLYLVVKPTGTKSYVYIFRWGQRQPEMGLGSVRDTTLSEARDKALNARRLVRSGVNPIDSRKASKSRRQEAPTFGEFADGLVEILSPGFRSPKHLYQWKQTLGDAYCGQIRSKRLDAIDTQDILAILTPIWTTKAETATRLRGRLERVLDAAKTKGLRTGENPARWKGHLEALLPRPPKLQRGHHMAMPYMAVPDLMIKLRGLANVSAQALQFMIFTASRVSETLNATWAEVDLDAAIWTILARRTKSGREHRVPLTPESLSILQNLKANPVESPDDFIFLGQGQRGPLSNMTFAILLKRLGVSRCTPHGFRSSFRDWAGETTSYDRETCELALGHRIGNAVEQAYRRKDSLEKRRRMMSEWATYISRMNPS